MANESVKLLFSKNDKDITPNQLDKFSFSKQINEIVNFINNL